MEELARGDKVALVVAEGERGVVDEVFGTTATVRWAAGGRTRVSRGSLKIISKARREERALKIPTCKSARRRTRDVVNARLAALGWTQAQLAEKAGVTAPTINRFIEDGTGLISTLEAVARALDVAPGDFWEVR